MRPPRGDRSAIHQPVLVHEVCELLGLTAGQRVVDATVGAGGHSRVILSRIQPGGLLIGIDRDPMMLRFAAEKLGGSSDAVLLKQASYVELPEILSELKISSVDRFLADLGLSSDQLADVSRGFSFDADGPLDLRFDPSSGEPAAQLIAHASRDELSRIFRDYGEEPSSFKIADRIVEARRRTPVQTARQLAEVVRGATLRHRASGQHPATRVFQALRIAVNQELQQLSTLVNSILPEIVVRGGRAAIISFHSLEDRIVKQAFRDKSLWRPFTPKPVTASSVEKRQNPRSRAAKLRVAERV